jgi:threonine dehydrogenase-like Zn-dependent dehydrogenase
LPVKYGYIAVGEIEAGAGTKGQMVFCLHPHQTHFVVPADAVVPLPSALPPSRAVLAPNLETALNGMWDGDLKPSHKISVVGAGVVGTLLAWLIRQSGCADVELIDQNPARAATAASLGIPFAMPEAAQPERDRVFHASGSPAGLRAALDLCANEATVIEMSWFGDTDVSLPLGGRFHSRRLTIVSSQVGQVAKSHRSEWTHRRRIEYVLELLADHAELDELIDGQSSFLELPQTMSALADATAGVLCHRVCY